MRTQENILTDSIFLTALAADLMLADLEKRLKANNEGLRQRSKQNLNGMIRHMKMASHFGSELMQEVIDADEKNGWKNIQTWQDEANEVARLILLWEDREPMPDVCNKIFKFIRSTKGEGVVDENLLRNYYLNKTIPVRVPEVGDRILSKLHGYGTLEFNTCGTNWAVELEGSGEQIILDESTFELV